MRLCCRWEGEGNDKRWVVDETTCSCGQVTRETRVQVPFLDCRLAKRKECRWGYYLPVSTLSSLSSGVSRSPSVARFLTRSASRGQRMCARLCPRPGVATSTGACLILCKGGSQSRCAGASRRVVTSMSSSHRGKHQHCHEEVNKLSVLASVLLH